MPKLLCIGGPISGQWREDNAPRMRALAKSDISEPLSIKPMESCATVEQNIYKRETFHANNETITFWVPEEQTPIETMKHLVRVFAMYGGK